MTFRVQPGDRIGLVGRNGAGKTTLTKTLAKQTLPAAGHDHAQRAGRLPAAGPAHRRPRRAGPRPGAVAPAGSTSSCASIEKSQVAAGRAARRRRRARAVRPARGAVHRARAATPPRPRPPASAATSGLPERALGQQLGTLSGGQRRRIELARILFSDATTLLLDEPTNHLDADSIAWLRGFLPKHAGGLIVISHDVELLDAVVNKVFHLDANRAALDQYNVGWKTYLAQRETDEKRRKRERLNAEKQAGVLNAQAEKMRAKATKAKAAQGMFKRAEKLLAGVEGERAQDRVAKLRFPEPAPCGKTPLTAQGLSKSYGSLEIFTDVDLAIDRGARVVVLGLNGAGKTTLLRVLSGTESPDTGEVLPGHGLRLGYYAQEHDTLDTDRTVLENMRSSSPDLAEPEARRVLGSFLFSGDVVHQKAGTLSGGEKTRLALATLVVSGANVLLLDEPTNNLDPASREEVLGALAGYKGAVVLVTHDEGAVVALQPEKVLLLPDGVEDQWSDDFADLVALA